jgi:hypothetical protein
VTPTADWFAYGDVVVDRLVGRRRCEVARIHCATASPPHPALARLAFGIPDDVMVAVTDVPPRTICTLDEIVLLASGELVDRVDRTVCALRPDELAIELTTYDLLAEDILRLDRWHKVYPEIRFGPALADFLASALAHLDALAPSFDTLGLLIASYALPDTER